MIPQKLIDEYGQECRTCERWTPEEQHTREHANIGECEVKRLPMFGYEGCDEYLSPQALKQICDDFEPRGRVKRFWLSWYACREFIYDGPWWISGYTTDADGSDVAVICAAVEAVSEEAAKRAMERASNGGLIEWRFCTEQPEDWDPFCDRFPRTCGMNWGEK